MHFLPLLEKLHYLCGRVLVAAFWVGAMSWSQEGDHLEFHSMAITVVYLQDSSFGYEGEDY